MAVKSRATGWIGSKFVGIPAATAGQNKPAQSAPAAPAVVGSQGKKPGEWIGSKYIGPAVQPAAAPAPPPDTAAAPPANAVAPPSNATAPVGRPVRGADPAKMADPTLGTSHKYIGMRHLAAGGNRDSMLQLPEFAGWTAVGSDKVRNPATGAVIDVTFDDESEIQWSRVGGTGTAEDIAKGRAAAAARAGGGAAPAPAAPAAPGGGGVPGAPAPGGPLPRDISSERITDLMKWGNPYDVPPPWMQQPGQGQGQGQGQGPEVFRDDKINEAIMRLLQRGERGVTREDVEQQYSPVAAQMQRNAARAKAAAAERGAFGGTNIGGAGRSVDAEARQIDEQAGLQQGQLMAQLIGSEITQRRGDVVNALQSAQGEQKLALERQLALIDAELRRFGLEQQNQQFYDNMGYNIGRDAYDRSAQFNQGLT